MKAIELPHYKLKLRDVAKDLYREHGWKMPRGFVDAEERDPANFSLAEWQQAKRAGHEPKALKTMFQDCWTMSDSGKGFAAALAGRGYTLARGDRRGHVAVDFRGEVYAVAKFVGVRVKEVCEKLGSAEILPSVDDARRDIAARMSEMLQRHIREVEADLQAKAAAMAARKREIVLRQRQQRAALEAAHVARHQQETQERAGRFAKGLRGLWDRLTGTHGKINLRNELETARTRVRDRDEKDQLVFRQLDERRALHRDISNTPNAFGVSKSRLCIRTLLSMSRRRPIHGCPCVIRSAALRRCLPWRQSPGEREGRIANVEPGSFEAVAATPTLWSPSLHEFLQQLLRVF